MRPKDGKDGKDGESVYKFAQRVDNFTGTELEFLDSLKGTDGLDGAPGKSAYERAVELMIESVIKRNDSGNPIIDSETGELVVKTEEEWLESLKGINGQDGGDIYDLAVELGYTGSKEEFLASTMGIEGPAGPAGKDGTNGIDGLPGKDGKDGLPGRDGIDGKDGLPGRDGIDGINGRDATLDFINILDIKNPSMDQLQIRINGGSGFNPENEDPETELYQPPSITIQRRQSN
jgi:hypothetical protein